MLLFYCKGTIGGRLCNHMSEYELRVVFIAGSQVKPFYLDASHLPIDKTTFVGHQSQQLREKFPFLCLGIIQDIGQVVWG